MTDSDFIIFQDDFYNLLEKYGIKEINGDHEQFNNICEERNKLVSFIDKLKVIEFKKKQDNGEI